MNTNSIQSLSDEQLLRDLATAAARERDATTDLIALLAEMDARRLYLQQGYSSLFVYCTGHLHLSEHAAYGRIEAARAARRFPLLLELLADGSITLTTLRLLSNRLTIENHQRLLDAAKNKSRREVEQQVAALHPLPDAASVVRKLPHRTILDISSPNESSAELLPAGATAPRPVASAAKEAPASVPGHHARPALVCPIAPERYKVQFTVGPETHRKLRVLQDLMRHVVPNGDLAEIFDRAITALLRDVERRKFAGAKRPKSADPAVKVSGRHVPASVKREVWTRDRGQCAFVGATGRCRERGFLEFHHVVPFADGGGATVENLQLRCRAHNAYEAREHVDT